MAAALRPSYPPPALRAKTIPRSLVRRSPVRARARQLGARALDQACISHGLGSGELAHCLGLATDRQGCEARSGALPVTIGELIALAPIAVVIETIADLLRDRLAAERIAKDSVELRLCEPHLAALVTLLATH